MLVGHITNSFSQPVENGKYAVAYIQIRGIDVSNYPLVQFKCDGKPDKDGKFTNAFYKILLSPKIKKEDFKYVPYSRDYFFQLVDSLRVTKAIDGTDALFQIYKAYKLFTLEVDCDQDSKIPFNITIPISATKISRPTNFFVPGIPTTGTLHCIYIIDNINVKKDIIVSDLMLSKSISLKKIDIINAIVDQKQGSSKGLGEALINLYYSKKINFNEIKFYIKQ